MPKEGNVILNVAEVRREVAKALSFVEVNSKKVTSDTGFSSIVGRRRKPLVIRY